MEDVVQLSRSVIEDASQMGRMLAVSDPAFAPKLDDAHHHGTYVRFMLAHRQLMQSYPAFSVYAPRLQRLVEIEAKREGLKFGDPAQQGQIDRQLSVPIHCAFWYGWERVQALQHKYEQAVAEHRKSLRESEQVLQVADGLPSSGMADMTISATSSALREMGTVSSDATPVARRPNTPLA